MKRTKVDLDRLIDEFVDYDQIYYRELLSKMENGLLLKIFNDHIKFKEFDNIHKAQLFKWIRPDLLYSGSIRRSILDSPLNYFPLYFSDYAEFSVQDKLDDSVICSLKLIYKNCHLRKMKEVEEMIFCSNEDLLNEIQYSSLVIYDDEILEYKKRFEKKMELLYKPIIEFSKNDD